ncbi:hypothetical protein [Marinagarivorans cellulosilyticus]|uniref:Uncharacterized protein n=1 Tax=Marinagarivorans cellulosilyticus TaxID=2721545 RepID=A0AAN2BJZ3_9GAMM|nr:hypothetical protein [Marinagarivorans cellulosilyticus]BCD97471.1 hypothetical protein MARGE09_P1672 [Marinagarivorans cellulosilyticus]
MLKYFVALRNSRYWQALIVHYSADPKLIFKQFRLGVIGFAIGLGLIIVANNNMPASIEQELCVLAGLIIGGVGFIVAMLAQMRLMIGRFVRFYSQDNK